MKKFLIVLTLFSCIFMITGCGKDKEVEPRAIEFGKTYEIKNHETVKLPDGTTFTVTQLGNTTCDRDAEFCEFDGLRIYYELNDGKNKYDQTNTQESVYDVKTGRTDYKNFVDVTINKKDQK